MERVRAWLQASRPASQTYIAFPILLGQILYYRVTGDFTWIGFVLAQLFGVFDQLYIVYANDWADVETDERNGTYNIFSGGSRVIVDGQLSRAAVGRAAVGAAVLAGATGVALLFVHGSAIPLMLMVLGIALLYGYSYPPLRMNYRGGGEALQMIGVGGVLPLVGFSAHSGQLTGFPWAVLAVTLPISLGCAIATSLPDEPSDRASKKRTAGVLLGSTSAQVLAMVLCAASLVVWVLIAEPEAPIGLRLAAVAAPLAALVSGVGNIGSTPGSKRLTALVARFVVTNVIFFVGASVAIAVG